MHVFYNVVYIYRIKTHHTFCVSAMCKNPVATNDLFSWINIRVLRYRLLILFDNTLHIAQRLKKINKSW